MTKEHKFNLRIKVQLNHINTGYYQCGVQLTLLGVKMVCSGSYSVNVFATHTKVQCLNCLVHVYLTLYI
uniref:Uncharacterized protein n=1 Tax=Anguilla anguilla TaxID=7936 RepID=A0A0E9REW0_ANGAN